MTRSPTPWPLYGRVTGSLKRAPSARAAIRPHQEVVLMRMKGSFQSAVRSEGRRGEGDNGGESRPLSRALEEKVRYYGNGFPQFHKKRGGCV